MLLGRRDYASFELADKLSAKGYTLPAIEEALGALRAERLLDDGRYLENFVRVHTARGQGPARMRQELRQLGFGGEAIEAAIGAGPDYVALCREVRARKFGQKAPASWAEKGKQSRFLQYRGFSSDHIRVALGQDPETLENPADEHS